MTKVTACPVNGSSRMNFFPEMVGNDMRLLLISEAGIYNFLRHMSKDYTGGMWAFVKLSNGGMYMYPEMGQDKIEMKWADNFYEGKMSPEAAGIVACMMFFSNASLQFNSEIFGTRYHQLRDYALDHPEAQEIFKALD